MHALSIISTAILLFSAGVSAADVPARDAKPAADQAPVTSCVQDTGSRIKRKPGECNGVVGRTYNSEQIDQTGANDAGQALRLLDPSVTVQRN